MSWQDDPVVQGGGGFWSKDPIASGGDVQSLNSTEKAAKLEAFKEHQAATSDWSPQWLANALDAVGTYGPPMVEPFTAHGMMSQGNRLRGLPDPDTHTPLIPSFFRDDPGLNVDKFPGLKSREGRPGIDEEPQLVSGFLTPGLALGPGLMGGMTTAPTPSVIRNLPPSKPGLGEKVLDYSGQAVMGAAKPFFDMASQMSSPDSMFELMAALTPIGRILLASKLALEAPHSVGERATRLGSDLKAGPGDYVDTAVGSLVDVATPFGVMKVQAPETKPSGIKPTETPEIRHGDPAMPFMMPDAPRRVLVTPYDQPKTFGPPLINQMPVNVEGPLLQDEPVPVKQWQGPPFGKVKEEPLGGQVSFAGEGVPSAMQARVIPSRKGVSEQAALSEGEFVPSKEKLHSGIPLNEILTDIDDEKMYTRLIGTSQKQFEREMAENNLQKLWEKYGGLLPTDFYRESRGLDETSSLYSGLPGFDTQTWKDTKEAFKTLLSRTDSDRRVLTTELSSRGRAIKDIVAARADAIEQAPMIAGSKAETKLRLEAERVFGKKETNKALEAANVFMEAKGDKSKLATFRTQAAGTKWVEAVDYADANWNKLAPIVSAADAIDVSNLTSAKAAGLRIPEKGFYVKRAYESGFTGLLFRDTMGPSVGRKSLLPRKYDTIFDAMADGYKPLSLNLADLVAKRTREIHLDANLQTWTEAFKKVTFEKQPIVTDLKKVVGKFVAPEGYVKVQIPGQDGAIAVLQGFHRIFQAATSESRVSGSLTGQALLQGVGAVKHSTLAFDTFHLSRVTQFYQSLAPGGKYKHGIGLLEFDRADLQEAIRQKKLPDSILEYVDEPQKVPQGTFSRKQLLDEGVHLGLNVGRHSEALYTNFVRETPILRETIGRYNKFLFEGVTRGAMADAFVHETVRVARDNPTWSMNKVERRVARDLNFRFGSMGRQGFFKARTFQDLAQIAFMAPRWVWSMAQSEARSVGQLGVSMVPGEQFGKRPTLLRSTSNILAAYVVGTQILNMATTGHPTWKNDEGHKLDAWIPPIKEGEQGFWLSPLSVAAEVTHDIVRYAHKGKNPVEIATQIAENKLSNVGRAVDTAITGGPMNRGQTDVKGAISELVNPTPLPFRQAKESLKRGEVSPFERQAFATAGFKAEPESTQERRERMTYGMDLAERSKWEKEQKAKRKFSDEGGARAAKLSVENKEKRRQSLVDTLPKDTKKWLDNRELRVPGYGNLLSVYGNKVPLTDRETKRYGELVDEEYGKTITHIRSDKSFDTMPSEDRKVLFNNLMKDARTMARTQLIKEMESRSMNEQNKKKRRFSAFDPSQ